MVKLKNQSSVKWTEIILSALRIFAAMRIA